jgi:hypothetical protein
MPEEMIADLIINPATNKADQPQDAAQHFATNSTTGARSS